MSGVTQSTVRTRERLKHRAGPVEYLETPGQSWREQRCLRCDALLWTTFVDASTGLDSSRDPYVVGERVALATGRCAGVIA